MTTTPDVSHYREAESTLEVVGFAHDAETVDSYAEYAQAEATLAVADELKTANLIAYLAAVGTSRMAYLPGESVLKSIQADIEVRLGLA